MRTRQALRRYTSKKHSHTNLHTFAPTDLLCRNIDNICIEFEKWTKENYYQIPKELEIISKHVHLEELMQKSGIDEMLKELLGYMGKFGTNFVLQLPPVAQNTTQVLDAVIEAFE